MANELEQAICAAISEATGETFKCSSSRHAGGGCINDARILSDGTRRYFVKLNTAANYPMFEAEAEGLKAILASRSICAPRPVTLGSAQGRAFIAMEALELTGSASGDWSAMGTQLAAMHRQTADRFGWHRDNTIGSTPQSNRRHDTWSAFFREERLRPQLELAHRNGFHFDRAQALLEAVDALLTGHTPPPSLLHGDLWSGNAGFTRDGSPVIFDPATYYGDRETDLAFTEFFGGFPPEFYRAYRQAWPLDPGYEIRKELYNLYHVLNHANLFGSSYAGQAGQMIRFLLG
ncbi:fructosamine kinase family protein [Coraliomargarita parva]|uniref:fructosamine kinase family protein n=1 Tax=Coraliomargarita parva TaxID=3014050 RepID=UPI0022B2D8E2|nr:fructosamine kinase family protein [Coraliomargarita parva]